MVNNLAFVWAAETKVVEIKPSILQAMKNDCQIGRVVGSQ